MKDKLYKKKHDCETLAFQYAVDPSPDWFGALVDAKIAYNCILYPNDIILEQGFITQAIKPNMWIIKDNDKVFGLTADEFHDQYEAVL